MNVKTILTLEQEMPEHPHYHGHFFPFLVFYHRRNGISRASRILPKQDGACIIAL